MLAVGYNLLRRIAPLRAVVRGVRGLLAKYRPNVWLIKGRERWTGEPLSVICAGQLQNKNFIADLAFAGSPAETPQGRMWIWNALRLSDGKFGGSPLTVVDMNRWAFRALRYPANFWIPCWIGSELDLDRALLRIKRSRNAKKDLKRLRKQCLHYEVTSDRNWFDRFYREMYVPYIRNVYGNRAFLMSYDEMMDNIDRSELLLVKKQDEYIAGGILIFENEQARAWSLGVKDGDRAYVKAMALKAHDYFMIQHLVQKGYRTVNMGASRPFLRDGVLRHKKIWGVQIVNRPARGFALKLPQRSAGIGAFVKNNPFIYEQDGAYYGALFVEKRSILEDEVRALHKDYYFSGLRGITIFQFGEGHQDVSIPADLADEVSTGDGEELFHGNLRGKAV